MKIPKHIINKMHKLAKLNSESMKLSHEIDNWFMENGFNIESLRSGTGRTLDELDYGNDITDEFIEELQNNTDKYKSKYSIL